jgi:putative ATPase
VGTRVARQREAQLAAMLEGAGLAPVERLTSGPGDKRLDRWLQRTASRFGARLASLRDAVFEAAELQRHHTVLDLHAGTGLLTWEAVRQCPEGGIWAWSPDARNAGALMEMAARLPDLSRPSVLQGTLDPGPVRFDRVIGRDVLARLGEAAPLALARSLIRPDGRLVLVEALTRRTQRLSALVPDFEHTATWRSAEDAVYSDPEDPLTRRDAGGLQAQVEAAGWRVEVRELPCSHLLHITEAVLDRWFSDRPGSYGSRLCPHLTDLGPIERAARRALSGKTVTWSSTSLLLVGEGR